MAALFTQYDILLRLAHMSCYAGELADHIRLKKTRGGKCILEEQKLTLMIIFMDILSCYEPITIPTVNPNCLDEDDIQHISEVLSELSGCCFPPPGINIDVSVNPPPPAVEVDVLKYLLLEDNGHILLEDGDHILLEYYT